LLLVDSYNVLHAAGSVDPALADLSLADLLDLIGGSRYRSSRCWLVCDGRLSRAAAALLQGRAAGRLEADIPGSSRVQLQDWKGLPAGGELWFSGADLEADDVIERLLAGPGGEPKAASGLVVVSSDRRLIRAARRAGAQVIESREFVAAIWADRRAVRPAPLPAFATDIPLDRYSVAHWLREFGMEVPPDGFHARPSPTPPLGSVVGARFGGRGAVGKNSGGKKAGRKSGGGGSDRGGTGFGSRLAVSLSADFRPVADSPKAVTEVGAVPASPSDGAASSGGSPTPAAPAKGAATEPWISEALELWAGRLSVEDLEMTRWLTDVKKGSRRGGGGGRDGG
jgi:hypothetical protein